ncbi:MAG: hypothetical protein ACK4IS_08360 [Erythrobacter sp.]
MTTRRELRIMALRGAAGLGLGGAALMMAGVAAAQDLQPLSPAEVNTLPPEYRTAPAMTDRTERTIGADGVETITRTRYIAAPAAAGMAAPAHTPPHTAYPGAQPAMLPMGYGMQQVVFDRAQWIEECRRRTAGQSRDNTGTIIGALLGAIGGGVGGNLIAGTGDKVLGTVVGAVGGGLGGGLIGSLFNGRKRNRYDCEAALDAYMSQGTPVQRIASREIPAAYAPPAYAYPVMIPPTYAYAYAPPQQVLVETRTQQPQQVIVRETVREEIVPGAARVIPAPRPTKLIKLR